MKDADLVGLWVTRDLGRNWMGCKHGRGHEGAPPLRICDECFEEVIRFRLEGERDQDEERD